MWIRDNGELRDAQIHRNYIGVEIMESDRHVIIRPIAIVEIAIRPKCRGPISGG